MKNKSRKQIVYLRIEPSLNLRIDQAVLRRREETGRRVSRAEVIAKILEDGLDSHERISPQEGKKRTMRIESAKGSSIRKRGG